METGDEKKVSKDLRSSLLLGDLSGKCEEGRIFNGVSESCIYNHSDKCFEITFLSFDTYFLFFIRNRIGNNSVAKIDIENRHEPLAVILIEAEMG